MLSVGCFYHKEQDHLWLQQAEATVKIKIQQLPSHGLGARNGGQIFPGASNLEREVRLIGCFDRSLLSAFEIGLEVSTKKCTYSSFLKRRHFLDCRYLLPCQFLVHNL